MLVWTIWIFATPALTGDRNWLWPTLGSFAIFLLLYWRAYFGPKRHVLWCTLGIAALSFALTPVKVGGGECYLIYACAFMAFTGGNLREAIERMLLLALLYALEHPGRVGRLALVSPAPTWREARERFEAVFSHRNLDPAFQEERRALRESGLRERDPAAFQRRIFELSVAPYFFDPSRARDLTPFRVVGRTQDEVWRSLGNYDLRPRLPQLAGISALVLHGEADPIPIDAARTAAELLGAEFHPVPRCGHVPYVEAFDTFRTVVGGFL
jgi:hypothetical protein